MKRIIDNRKKEKFMVDDAYLNGMAKLCGWQGTIVYMSLCRHANKGQECFPAVKLMAEENGVGRDTIIKGISRLEKRKVIEVKKSRNKGGKWINNTYILLDKSVWKYDQVDISDTVNQVDISVSPCRSQRKTKSATPTLRKHIEGNTYSVKQSFTIGSSVSLEEKKNGSVPPFSSSEYIASLRKSPQPHIKIVGWYMKAKGMDKSGLFPTKKACEQEMRRNLKPAKELADGEYPLERIRETAVKLVQKKLSWTLETINKNINKIEI